jgi:probable rRNA maturation factor
MSVWIEWEVDTPNQTAEWEALFRKVVAQSLAEEAVTVPVEVSITVTGPQEIQELNRDYRQIDRVTDVLSFPQWDYEGEAPQTVLEEAETDPDTGEVCLGDIVICLNRAKEQAEEYGHSLERELGFLAAHSMLHLLGYDHMEPEEEKRMMDKQEKILQALNLTR